MNGIKWSQIEPDCDPESDRVLSVKPANAPGNSKKGKIFFTLVHAPGSGMPSRSSGLKTYFSQQLHPRTASFQPKSADSTGLASSSVRSKYRNGPISKFAYPELGSGKYWYNCGYSKKYPNSKCFSTSSSSTSTVCSADSNKHSSCFERPSGKCHVLSPHCRRPRVSFVIRAPLMTE